MPASRADSVDAVALGEALAPLWSSPGWLKAEQQPSVATIVAKRALVQVLWQFSERLAFKKLTLEAALRLVLHAGKKNWQHQVEQRHSAEWVTSVGATVNNSALIYEAVFKERVDELGELGLD